MAAETPVDEAFERYMTLSAILDRVREIAVADPTHARNIQMGLTEEGMKKSDAREHIIQTFEELTSLLNHVVVIDMAAAFERYFLARVTTAIGEARRVVRTQYNVEPFSAVREKLVKEADDFQGLAQKGSMLVGQFSPDLNAAWKLILEARNKFAHGTDILTAPAIASEEAKDALNEILQLF